MLFGWIQCGYDSIKIMLLLLATTLTVDHRLGEVMANLVLLFCLLPYILVVPVPSTLVLYPCCSELLFYAVIL